MSPEQEVATWVDTFVVRLGLCPFAARPLRHGLVRYHSTPVASAEEAFYWAGAQVQSFLGEPRTTVETTLLLFPNAFDSFDSFLDFVEEMEELLETAGADAYVQFAHFHPGYRFAGLDADDPANKTNRSPHPVLQLLRVEGVAEAVANYPEVASIPERNIKLLRRLAAADEG
ncbi:hypothetical protein CLV84_3029 [Neolewinella xylanilytica]|uniref:DUF1415 domain-containing protein n=1 Tax=Neolewinella xylanilytica TaxID=1514080 RepID=A0A2S6I4N4_9BACT|nr:DUF1415 domain-containing protein [Neolewinella xylanilytica]PPK86112.1 hypothetical protein CLV84_3029 [Neolewinella xylanilytica]